MSRARLLALALALAAGGGASPASAAVPLNGLAVAVSSDGSKLVAGGDPRTLLVLDPATLEVKERLWIETPIVRLAFDKAGSTLAVVDTDGAVLLFSSADWKRKGQIKRREPVAISVEAGLIAGLEAGAVHLNALSDGAERGKVALPPNFQMMMMGLSADGTKLAIFTMPRASPEEKTVAVNDVPKDLKGVERDEFMMRNDGKATSLLVLSTANGEKLAEHASWYSMGERSAMVVPDDDGWVLVNYSNVNVRVSGAGETKMLKGQNSFNYGMGTSPDGRLMITGGMREFTVTKVAGFAGARGEIDKLPGYPEYFKSFDATADGGAIYGGTSGYRVVKIGLDGKVLAVAPVR